MAASGKYTASTVFKAVDNYTNPVKAMSRTTGNFATKAQAGFLSVERSARKLNKTTNILSRSVKGMVAGFGLTLALQGTATAAITLDKNLSSAAAKFQVFDRESETFEKLEESARKYGATTEFTAGQAAKGLEKLGVAGFSAEQAMASLGTVLNLATATQAEFGVAADVSAKTLAAFGLKAKDPLVLAKNLNVASDVLNKIITTSGFGELDQFLDTLSMSGSVARAAGVDIQTWGAIVAGSVSEAVPASTAGTRFANMLSHMAKKTKVFNKEGIVLKDKATGGYRNIIDILEDIETKTKGMDKLDRAGLLFKLFGERGSKMATSLLDNGIPALREYHKEIVNSEGQTAKMAAMMRGGLAGSSMAMVSAITEVGHSFEKTFRGEILEGINIITDAGRATGIWIKENKELIRTVGSAAKLFVIAKAGLYGLTGAMRIGRSVAAAYNIVAATTNIITGTSVLKYRQQASAMVAARTATTALGVAQKVLQGPVGWITLGITAATVGIIAYSKATQSAEKISKKFGKSVQKDLFKETSRLDDYFEQLKKTNPESERRKKILDEMHAQFPDLLRDYDLQKAKLEEIEQAQTKSTAALRKQIIEEATAAKKKEILASSINKVSEARDKLFDLGLTNEQVNRATSFANKGAISSGAAMGLASEIAVGGSTQRLVSEIISTMSRFGTGAIDPQIEAIQQRAAGMMGMPTDLEAAGIVKSENNTTTTQNQKVTLDINGAPTGSSVSSTGDNIIPIPTFFTSGFLGY